MIKEKKYICHLTSVHQRYDVRIFLKECISLVKNGYNVTLIVADGKGNEYREGVNIIDVGKKEGRMNRILFSTYRVYKKAIELNTDIYHFHDPELLPYGYLLKLKQKKVVYDSHEDLPRQFLTKPYLNKFIKVIFSKIIEYLENLIVKKLSGVVSATPHIYKRFSKVNHNNININNFPIINNEKLSSNYKEESKDFDLVYIGHISNLRGFQELKYVTNLLGIRTALAGVFSPESLKSEMLETKQIKWFGYLDKKGVKDLLLKSKIGYVALHPTESYKTSLPVKMFEYLQMGIPIIASNFPLWKGIIEQNKCGICVNPEDSHGISMSIKYLLENPLIADKMGENGKKIVFEQYNWNVEEAKLIKFYKQIK